MRPRTGWRYTGLVHEVLEKYDENHVMESVMKLPDEIFLYQDRLMDDDKTVKRYPRDIELLKQAHFQNPSDTRAIYYLGHTLLAMQNLDEAFYYYKLRASSPKQTSPETDVSLEEVFSSYMRLGMIAAIFKHPWEDTMKWYMLAFETISRAEPVVAIATYYARKQSWVLSFTFAQLACSLPYPSAMLWIDRKAYDYSRWHLLGTVGFFVGKIEEGRTGCLNAIATGVDVDGDKANLAVYNS
jgi:tetratricopeptide (TPR) repeat protein